MLEGFDLASLDPSRRRDRHLLLEAMRVAFRRPARVRRDPAFARIPFRGLASKEFAERDAARGNPRIGRTARARPGDPWPFDARVTIAFPQRSSGRRRWGPTTPPTSASSTGPDGHLDDAIDHRRIWFRCGCAGNRDAAEQRHAQLQPDPGPTGSIAPWKRSAHDGTPTVVLDRDGAPRAAIGGAGGTKIVTGVVQVLLHVLDHGWEIQAALARRASTTRVLSARLTDGSHPRCWPSLIGWATRRARRCPSWPSQPSRASTASAWRRPARRRVGSTPSAMPGPPRLLDRLIYSDS